MSAERPLSGGDYAGFLSRGEPEWEELDSLLVRARREGIRGLGFEGVERLAALQRRAASDFAYARTHYPNTAAHARLRQLVFQGHRLLARPSQPILKRLWRFLHTGFRETFQGALPYLWTSLSIFCGATILGFVIGALEPGLVDLFFGPGAVAGIRRGEIWTDSVGSVIPPAILSSSIFTNNMTVALIAWAGGASFGLLSLHALLLNGVMFGAVLAACWRYELLSRLGAFIAAHGPLELYLITVSAAAGLMLGHGALAAGPTSRAERFAAAGRESVKLMGGTLPWFVLLGLVEGNISPVMTLPTPLKALLGAILLSLFLLYALLPVRRPAHE